MTILKKIDSTKSLPVGTMKSYTIGEHRVLIAHTENGFFGVADECSHDLAPFADGTLHRSEIECPRHGARFELATGDVTAPPAVAPIDTYDLVVDGQDLYIRLED